MPDFNTSHAAEPHAETTCDDSLNCYRCGYDLTGLPQPRCPECGLEFAWDDPRLRAVFHRGIAFEKARSLGIAVLNEEEFFQLIG